MTATDELRRLLDERGVEYYETPIIKGARFYFDWVEQCGSYTKYVGVDGACCYAGWEHIEPAQAIAATLGRGKCTNMDEETDAEWFTCSECNTELRVHEPFSSFSIRYCPNCGREVVSE